jgi:hypothetical protein
MDMTPVVSSNVAAVGYADTTLTVRFNSGAVYEYLGVPSEVHEKLMAADSVGQYLNKFVKPVFTCNKVEG